MAKPTVLSKHVISESKDNDYIVYRVRIKLSGRQSILNAIESFYTHCSCSYDCCGHWNVMPLFSSAKHSKRKEYTFELSAYRNV